MCTYTCVRVRDKITQYFIFFIKKYMCFSLTHIYIYNILIIHEYIICTHMEFHFCFFYFFGSHFPFIIFSGICILFSCLHNTTLLRVNLMGRCMICIIYPRFFIVYFHHHSHTMGFLYYY